MLKTTATTKMETVLEYYTTFISILIVFSYESTQPPIRQKCLVFPLLETVTSLLSSYG